MGQEPSPIRGCTTRKALRAIDVSVTDSSSPIPRHNASRARNRRSIWLELQSRDHRRSASRIEGRLGLELPEIERHELRTFPDIGESWTRQLTVRLPLALTASSYSPQPMTTRSKIPVTLSPWARTAADSTSQADEPWAGYETTAPSVETEPETHESAANWRLGGHNKPPGRRSGRSAQPGS